jgi:hypothetical protein
VPGHNLRILIAVLAVLGIGAGAVMFSGEVRHQLALSFSHVPVKYSELYFDTSEPPGLGLDHTMELGAVLGDRPDLEFSFTVANHEGVRTPFPYAVDVVDDAHVVLGHTEGEVTVAEGEARSTPISVDVVAPQRWAAIEVHLVGRDEHIRFLRAE